MSTLKEKREKITNLLVDLYNTLDPTKQNSVHFINMTSKMTDAQFIAYFTTLVSDPKSHLYLEIEAFKNEPSYEMIEKAANDVVGDKYCHLYDYIAFPHMSNDPNNPVVSVNKIFSGYINLRRVQQIVHHKSHIPTELGQRDPKTGEVVLESKAARVSDLEQFGMVVQGMDNVIKEMYGPRGGDAVMRTEMEQQIAASGSASLSDMTDSKMNKTSLRTADVYFTSAGLETSLVTSRGILPRTILEGNAGPKIMDAIKRDKK